MKLKAYILVGMLLLSATGCKQGGNMNEEYIVEVAAFEKASELVAILQASGIRSQVLEPEDDDDASTPENSKAIWIGKNVPLEIIKKTMVTTLETFPFLCYISITNDEEDPPESIHNEIFIGGDTETAIEENLKVIPSGEIIEALGKAKSITEFHQYIKLKNEG